MNSVNLQGTTATHESTEFLYISNEQSEKEI